MQTFWPHTRLGWVATVSFITFMMLYLINGYMVKASGYGQWWLDDIQPVYGVAMIITVVVACVGSVFAWAIGGDDAWAVRIATLPIWVWTFVHTLIFVLNTLHL